MSSNNGNNKRFSQLPEVERRARVAEMQSSEPGVKFMIELKALDNGQVMVGTPDGMIDSVKGCAMIQDVLAKAIRVVSAKLAGIETQESRIQVAQPGQVLGLKG